MAIGKIALVTGASRGIGRALALALAADGYRVALVSRTQSDLESLAAEINKVTEASVHAIDVTNKTDIHRCVTSVQKLWGPIDVLVNNAGVFEFGSIEVTSEKLDRLYEINLRAPFCFMQEVLPGMRERKSGYIFNIASISGTEAGVGYGAYGSSKFGLVGLNEALFKELAKENIKVTAICPSWVDTAMAVEAGATMDGELMIQPSDIAKTLRWLLSLSPAATISKVVVNCTSTVG